MKFSLSAKKYHTIRSLDTSLIVTSNTQIMIDRMNDDYVRSDGSSRDDMFICVLCNTGSMHKNNVASHVNGSSHRLNRQCNCWKDRAVLIDSTCPASHIERLGLLSWRQAIKADIHDYIFNGSSDFAHPVPTSITQRLDTYTKLEKTSLLEIAVWKASCLWFDGCINFHTMQDVVDLWAMDENFDPVTYKKERRFTSSVAVIMRGVLDFLE